MPGCRPFLNVEDELNWAHCSLEILMIKILALANLSKGFSIADWRRWLLEAIQLCFGINPGSVVLKPNLLAACSLLISLYSTRKVPLSLLLLIPLNSRASSVVAVCRWDLSSGPVERLLERWLKLTCYQGWLLSMHKSMNPIDWSTIVLQRLRQWKSNLATMTIAIDGYSQPRLVIMMVSTVSATESFQFSISDYSIEHQGGAVLDVTLECIYKSDLGNPELYIDFRKLSTSLITFLWRI